jgi:hypothetical protein
LALRLLGLVEAVLESNLWSRRLNDEHRVVYRGLEDRMDFCRHGPITQSVATSADNRDDNAARPRSFQ